MEGRMVRSEQIGIGSIQIIGKDGLIQEEVDVFQAAWDVVFDKNSMNYHVFPNDIVIYNRIREEIGKKRERIINKLSENERGDSANNLQFEQWKLVRIKPFKKMMDIISGGNVADNMYLLPGSGAGEIFTKYNNWVNESDENKKFFGNRYNIYKYITIYYNGAWYTLNFMRLYCDNKKVHCAFNALQYHRDTSNKGYGLNKGKGRLPDICYPASRLDGAYYVNNMKNVCYNPCLSFWEKEEVIINDFITFIEKCDKYLA